MGITKYRQLLNLSLKTQNSGAAALSTQVAQKAKGQDISQPNYKDARPFDDIPGPRRLPLIGTTWTFFPHFGYATIDRLHESVQEGYKRFGTIWRESSPGVERVVLADMKDIEAMFRSEMMQPIRPTFPSLLMCRSLRKDLFVNPGLASIQGDEWKSFRSRTQPPLMKPANVQNYADGMQDVSDDFIDRIRNKLRNNDNNEVPEDFQNEIYKWALESISLITLDSRLGCLKDDLPADSDAQQLIQCVGDFFRCLVQLELGLPLWKILPSASPTFRKFLHTNDTFGYIAERHIQKALDGVLQRLEKSKKGESDNDQPMTILEQFLVKQNLNVKETLVIAVDMLLGGVDTTSHAMGFLLYHIAANKDKQQKLYEEIMRVVPDKSTRITSKHLNEMRYLKACMNESMRLTPIALLTIRQLTQDLVLSGYQVPKGTICMAANGLLVNMEENYPDTKKFVPERWLKNSSESKEALNKGNPFIFLPFGFGARNCIGKRIAEQEMSILVIKLLQHFRMDYRHEPVGIATQFIGKPDQPLKFAFIDRN